MTLWSYEPWTDRPIQLRLNETGHLHWVWGACGPVSREAPLYTTDDQLGKRLREAGYRRVYVEAAAPG